MYRNNPLTSSVYHLVVSLVVLGENLFSELWPAVSCHLYLVQFWVAAQGPRKEVSQGSRTQTLSLTDT